jgi:phosphoglycolate phosphatase
MDKYCIFDFDGTLANSIALGLEVYNEYAHKYKSDPIRIEEFPELRKHTYAEAMRMNHIRLSVLPAMILQLRKVMKGRMESVQPYDGIVPALEELTRLGYKLAVVTSNAADIVEQFLERHNFPPFEFVWAEKNLFGKDKALRHIVKRKKISREQMIYVGDEPRDVVACKKVGIRVIGVSWGLGGRQGFHISEPDLLIDAINQLTKAVEQLS